MTAGLRVNNIAPVGERPADVIRGRTGIAVAGVGTIIGSEIVGTPSDGDVLIYDAATDTWVPGPAATASTIGSPSAPTTIVNANYSAFPTLTHLDEDHVLLVYRRGTDHAPTLDGNLYYRILTLASDGTITVGGENTMWDHASLDIRDPSAMTASDGTIYVTVCTADGTGIGDNFVGYVIASTWDGATLTVGTPTAIGSSLAGVREIPMRMVQLEDGTFMLPICGLTSGTKDKVIVTFSADGLTSWGGEVTVASDASFFYTEPVAVMYDDGSIGMLIRENDARDIYSTFSYDFGLTWTALVNEFEGWGKPMHRQLDSGADLLVYREDDTTSTGRALYRISYDRMATWTDPLALGAAAMQYGDVLPLGVPARYGGGRTVLVAVSTQNSSTDADIVDMTFSDIADVRDGVGVAGDGSGSGGLLVSDEGIPLSGSATALDFVGDGVVATGSSGTKTITIAGGSTAGSGGASAIAYSSGDVTTTGSLQDVTGCSLSLTAGTYIIAGSFDVLVNSSCDRTFEGHLDSGGSDQTNIAELISLGLTNDRFSVGQHWRLTLTSTTTVKLRIKYSGGSTGDFTAKAQTSITAWSAFAVLTAPTFVAAGASASGTGAVVPGLPSGHTTNDINILFVQSDNQTATAPSGGWAQLGPAAGFGTAAGAGATRLSIFWKRDSGADTDPTVADTGDHTLAQIMGIRGCPVTGDPFLCIGTTQPKLTASTTGTASPGATPVDACLIVNAFTHALDSASAAFSAWTNASLASITERIDVATADGNGGGIGVATGVLTTAGSFVATTVTETSMTDVSVTFIMLPASITSRAGFTDTQIFVTAGFADTWTRPSGAKTFRAMGIGGGSSGTGGRNAGTAAGGGGGAGGGYDETELADVIPATLTVTAGAGGAITANSDGATGNAGNSSTANDGVVNLIAAGAGGAGTASGTGSGGAGGPGGGFRSSAPSAAAFADYFGSDRAAGGTGGTTAAAGGRNNDYGGGAGAGGGTSQAASAGGRSRKGAGGGGGGRSNTTVGTGGAGGGNAAPGATAGANGGDSAYAWLGGSGAAAGTSGTGDGGTGGWPGGGGGGGGSQSGHVTGGKGGDGAVTIVTRC